MMGQAIQGFRIGQVFATKAGWYRNGSEPSKEQRADLTAVGYTFSPHILTPEEQAAIERAKNVSERPGVLH